MTQFLGLGLLGAGALILLAAVRDESPIDVLVSTFDNREIRPFGKGGWVK